MLHFAMPCSLNRTCIILVCASCHVYVVVVYYVVCFFPGCFLVTFGFVPELWGFVRLRPLVFFMDSFFFLAGSQARWPYPRNHFYLCFPSCSLYRYAALPTTCYIMPPILPCKASNHPFLANRCLPKLPLLLSLLIALLVVGEFEVGSMLEHGYFGISQYLLFN